jgi:ComF family protein
MASIPLLKSVSCFICNRRSPTAHVCDRCYAKFHPPLAGLLVASDWDNLLLRQIIYKYKYNFIKELSLPLAKILIGFLEAFGLQNIAGDEIILVPVPLHKKRELWRGFNQSKILAQEIAEYFNLPLADDLLIRHRHTALQAEIKNNEDRKINMQNAFLLSSEALKKNYNLKNKTIILIDDVSTTSSTLSECARVIKPLKPKKIWGLVLARG